jgi:predicted RNA-binding protein with PUA-like domain
MRKRPRISIHPIEEEEWSVILQMSN